MVSKEMRSTSIESRLNQELSVVRCQFWVKRWRTAELYLTRGEVIDIGFFSHSVYCLSESSVDPAIGAPWNTESIPLGSTEFCILPIELFRSIGVLLYFQSDFVQTFNHAFNDLFELDVMPN